MSSSANVKLRYEKCLQVWGNAIDPYVDQLRYRYSLGIHMPRRKGAATFTEVIHTAYAQPD